MKPKYLFTLFVMLICGLTMINKPIIVSAEGIPSTPDNTPGVYIFTAGTDESIPGTCNGTAAGNPTGHIINHAVNFGILEFVGDTESEVLSFITGAEGESPFPGEVDTTLEEIVTGLTTIDDFGDLTGANDDDANFDTGTGGELHVGLRAPYRVIVPDGIIATGALGSVTPSTQAEADTNLDGMEIFIFEDSELSGFQLDLIGPFNTWSINIEDFQVNPGTANGADDMLIGIDLDSLPDWDGTYITSIRITDDGVEQAPVDSCDGVGPADQSLEIDAIATRKTIFMLGSISGSVLEDTDGDGIGDIPLPDVTLWLHDANDNPVVDSVGTHLSAVTGSQGNYIFTNIPPGDYIVVEDQPVGYRSVTEIDGGHDNDYVDNGIVNSIPVSLGFTEMFDTGNDFVELFTVPTSVSLTGQTASGSSTSLVVIGLFVALAVVSLRYTPLVRS